MKSAILGLHIRPEDFEYVVPDYCLLIDCTAVITIRRLNVKLSDCYIEKEECEASIHPFIVRLSLILTIRYYCS